MGFINEPLSKDQEKPYNIPGYKSITPRKLTIDKDRNIILFRYWTDRDAPDEQYFAFYWNDICYKAVMLQSFADDNSVKWTLMSFKQATPTEKTVNEEEVLDDLREAFKVYGISGYRFPGPNAVYNPSVKVIISF